MIEKINSHTLDNGLRVVLSPLASTKAVTVLVLFGTGSRYEPDKLAGISHYLEHMYFKGTKRRPTAQIIAEELDGLGSVYNAFTGKEYTGYFIKAAGKNLEHMLDLLSDMLFNPLFDPKEMEKEKGAVVQEISMYEDSPKNLVDDIYEENLFGAKHPLGRFIIGTRQKVMALKRADIVEYMRAHYVGANTTISIAGEFDPQKTTGLIKKYFGSMPFGKVEQPNPYKTSTIQKPAIHYRKTEQTHLILGAFGYSYSEKKKPAYKCLAIVLGGGMSSRLFSEIREKRGLAYDVRTGTSDYLETGTIATYAGVENSKAEEVVKLIVEQYKKIAKNLQQNELDRAKEILKGRMILDHEDSMNVAMRHGMDSRYGLELKTLEQRLAEVDRVKLAEVKTIARELFASPFSLSLIGPFKDTAKFDKLVR